VFFLLDTVPHLDLRRFYAPYEDETRGAPPFDPAMMVCLLLYAYCVGVFSSRKIALACERNLAFIAIVGTERPDFRTISDGRKLHLDALREVFVQVLRIAGEAGMVKLGNLATDGTTIQGNASRHKAMSYGYRQKEVERVREDIEALVTQAYHQDTADDAALGSRRGDERPAAEAERQRTGSPRRGKAPKPVEESPDAKAPTNFTDPELQIMRTNNKGWDYGGNAPASVDAAYQIIVACDVTAETNDKQQAAPMAQLTLAHLEHAGMAMPTDDAGARQTIPATYDSGYYSEAAALSVEQMGFEPYMAQAAGNTTPQQRQ
jgi:transposase